MSDSLLITERDDETTRARARPLAPDDRRAAILTAVAPLVRSQGRDITTRQIADAAGVAEGTLFRAFADKESLIDAAIERLFDPAPLEAAMREIDPSLPVDEKLTLMLALLRDRFAGIFGLMATLRLRERPHFAAGATRWLDTFYDVLGVDAHELSAPPEHIAHWLRLVAFSSTVPTFTAPGDFTDSDLARMMLHGVVCPASTETGSATSPRKDA